MADYGGEESSSGPRTEGRCGPLAALKELLLQQSALLDQFMELAERGRRAVANAGVVEVEEVWKGNEELLSRMVALDRKLQDCLAALASQLNLSQPYPHLAPLMESLPPAQIDDEFLALSRRLLEDSTQLRRCFERDAQLVSSALGLVQGLLDFFIRLGQASPIYTGQGGVGASARMGLGQLDRRA